MATAIVGKSQARPSPVSDQLMRLLRHLRVGPLFRWRFSGFRPTEILNAPVDLHLADPDMAHEFYHGRFALAGRIVQAGSISPFTIEPPSEDWEIALHDFSWLRHMDASRTEIAAAHSRSLLLDWIESTSKPIKGLAWRSDIVGRRIMAWLSHSDMLLQGATGNFSKKFLSSLGFQVRFLRTTVIRMDENETRLQAEIALAFAALSLPVSAKMEKTTIARLESSLSRQILPDGGHISRNPAVLLTLLTDLISLRHAYGHRGKTPPHHLIDAVERMLPALRFFQHQDGSLARFNGVGPVLPQRLAVVLGLDETAGHPFSNAPHSGFQRLHADATTLIADTGAIPTRIASHHAGAGCLSFEMSSGMHRFIINAGIDPYGSKDMRFLGRTTAAHSTATINDTSSCRFHPKEEKATARILSGPNVVKVERIDSSERQGFIASHDGYVAPFNLIHERGIALHNNGNVIDGFDRFHSPNSDVPKTDGGTQISIRFHLHPDVEVSHDGNGIRLEITGGDAWSFTSPDGEVQLDDSIDFANLNGPRRTRQIVLTLRPALVSKLHWRLVRII